MPIRIVQVDAFTNRPFAGNPAAVCVLPEPRPEQWMRDVAREMNLSETAFLTPQNGGYNLRWLTPSVEVDLCGHATVASAHVLWEDGHLPEGQQARFHTRSGLLLADRRGDWIELDFPAQPAEPPQPPGGLVGAGFPRQAGRARRADGGVACGAGSGPRHLRRQERVRLPGGGGFRSHPPGAGSGPFDAPQGAGARGDGDRSEE